MIRDFLLAFGIVTISYFALLNGIYLVFTVIAWRGVAGHLRAKSYARTDEAFASPLTPGVSILLPAYNEEAGIIESVRSLVGLRHPKHEVIVVNDGSTDRTMELLTATFALTPIRKALKNTVPCAPIRAAYVSRVHHNLLVLDKENGGKADALNAGVNAAAHPYVCAIDADAILEDDSLLNVAEPALTDPGVVAATGGIIRVANGSNIEDGRVLEVRLPGSTLASLQVVEYFRAFLVGRMGWSRLNALVLIAGAFGLFRRDLVEAAGGYRTDTVGEDVELVVRLHRYLRDRGEPYRIAFIPDPVCWSEAPEDFAALGRQRRRWQRGLAETLWRHRRMIFNPRYGTMGLMALPYFLFFELLGPMIELFGYVVIPLAVVFGLLDIGYLVAFLVVAVLLGMFLSLAAVALEEFSFRRYLRNRDVARMFSLAVVDNLGYRQLSSLWRALAFVDLARRKKAWGAQVRRGLGTPRGAVE
jgi:cellulose synthase/poly-beta-1,6-N-acetylglucosamine synthase-like glycosyltransferase